MPYNNQGQRPDFTNTARQGLSGLGVEAPGNIPGGAAQQVAQQGYDRANDYAQFQGGGGNPGMNQEQYLQRPMGPNPMGQPVQPTMPPQATNREQYLGRQPTRDRFQGYGRDDRRRRMMMEQRRRQMMQQRAMQARRPQMQPQQQFQQRQFGQQQPQFFPQQQQNRFQY